MKHAALFIFAFVVGCGGNVVVDHGSGGTGQGGFGHGGGSGGAGGMSSTLSVPPNTSNGTESPMTVTASSGGSCNTCSQVLGGASSAQICAGPDSDAYNGLLGCVCGGSSMCDAQCGANFCVHQAASNSCQSCMSSVCLTDYAQCTGAQEVSSAIAGGSTGSGMSCMTCSQFIQSGSDPSQLCPSSVSKYNDVATCICSGNCAMKCASTCNSGNTTQACQSCVFDPDPQGCDSEWSACESD